jgi:hypothetical protein
MERKDYQVSLRVSEELYNALGKTADEAGYNVSDLARQLLWEGIFATKITTVRDPSLQNLSAPHELRYKMIAREVVQIEHALTDIKRIISFLEPEPESEEVEIKE